MFFKDVFDVKREEKILLDCIVDKCVGKKCKVEFLELGKFEKKIKKVIELCFLMGVIFLRMESEMMIYILSLKRIF